MATLTSLGFSIFSTYSGTGVRRARSDIDDLRTTIQRTDGGLNSFTGRLTAVTTAAIALGPALLPIGEAAVAVTGGLTAMGVVAGSALGVYAVAAHGAITRTLEMAEAGQKLTDSQTAFVSAVGGMQRAWTNFIVSTQDMTLGNATIVVNALTRAISFLEPVVRAVNPIIRETALAFSSWVDRADGLQRFIDIVIQFGVPALRNLVLAGRDVLAVLGIAFRALLPLVIPLSEWLARGAASLRTWAEGGGFDRFLDRVQQNGPAVAAFFRALWDAVMNIVAIFRELAPLSLQLATNLLQVIAGLNPGLVAAAAIAFLTLRGALTSLMIPMLALRLALGTGGGAGIVGAFTTLVPLLLRLIPIVGAVVGAVILAWQHSQFFRDQVTLLWQQIQILWRDHLQPLIQKLQELWTKLEPVRVAIGFLAGLILGLFVNSLTVAVSTLGFFVDALGVLVTFFTNLIGWITTFVTTTIPMITGWVVNTAQQFAGWVANVATIFAGWVANIATTIAGWVASTAAQFAGWVAQTAASFAGWVAQVAASFAGWVAQTAAAFAGWVANTAQAFAGWIANTAQAFAGWIANTAQAFAGWIANTAQAFAGWVANVIQIFAGWIANTTSAFAGWIADIISRFAGWISDMISRFTSWAGDMLGIFTDWVSDVTSAAGDFISDIIDRFQQCWETIRDTASDLWNDILGVIEDAINAILTPINMLIDGFNNIAEVFGLPNIPRIEVNFAYGGMVPGFANGGVMNLRHGGTAPGYSPGRDRVPAMLAPGEGVLVPEATRALGGPSFIRAANNHFSHGRTGTGGPSISQLGFATGGVVPVQHFLTGGVAAALARAGVSPSLITQGEFSNGSLSAGTHLGSGVIDLGTGSPAILARLIAAGFAAWIRTPAQGFATHIHAVLIGDPGLSGPAQAQVASFLSGGSGLGVGGGGGGFNIADLFGDIGELLLKIVNGSSLADAMGGGGGGGIFGDIIGGLVDLFTPDGMMTELLFSLVTTAALETAFSGVRSALDALGLGDFWFADFLMAAAEKLLTGAIEFIMGEKPDSFNPADFAGGFTGVGQWSALAATAMALGGLNPNQLPAFLALMQAESGGNPMAINLSDSNAANGDPSRGLMQVIGATFARYHVPGTSTNIFDPLANMAAAAAYIADRYGGNVPGSPYGIGTPGGHKGWHIVGEYGPEWMNFRGGERVGSNQDLRDAIASGRSGGWDGDININFYGRTDEAAVRRAEDKLVPKLRGLLQQKAGTR